MTSTMARTGSNKDMGNEEQDIESDNVIIGLGATVQIQLYSMNEKTIYII